MLRPFSAPLRTVAVQSRAASVTAICRKFSSTPRFQLSAAVRRTAVQLQFPRYLSVSVPDLISSQADSAMASVRKGQAFLESADWLHMTPFDFEAVCDDIGRGRDFLNSLAPQDFAAVEAGKGTVSCVERAEALLLSAMRSEDIAHRAKDLKMEMEDKGTAGDGDCRPENWQAGWGDALDAVFADYAELLEASHPDDVVKIERSVGYELLLLKRVVHVDSFRFLYPKVHPSGFSASAD
mmetsp:Transcript_18159/g.36769  ORF Transcript_18159/g.36769 Transcript_18159/m.36769 type:complete len:238 (+) Transcript_18159:121-834(+)